MPYNGRPAWPPGLSDGLVLPCGLCGRKVDVDYQVTDEAWLSACPESLRRSVVCLPCLVQSGGASVLERLVEIQWPLPGARATIRARTPEVVLWPDDEP